MGGNNRLPKLAVEIACAHESAREAASASLRHGVEAGERLIEAKALLKHGQWLPWLKEHCKVSDRTARLYMRLARHKDVIDAKSATVADMTIRGEVAEITEPKWPEKLSEKFRAVRLLPIHGHVRIGVRQDTAGWDEVWIAPSFQHTGFFYITHIWTSRQNGDSSLVGCRRPIRVDYLAIFVDLHLSGDFTEGVLWSDRLYPPWTYNILLFDDAGSDVDSLKVTDEEDRAEIVNLAQSSVLTPNPVHMRADLEFTDIPPGPLCDLVFADDSTGVAS